MLLEKKGTATGQRTETLHRFPDVRNNLELFFERDWNEVVTATALARVKMRVKPKHFQMFDLYAVKQWPLRRISRTLGVNVAQVYLVKSRISRMLKQQTKQVQAQLARPPAPDFFRQIQNTQTV
jgi:RNA polymerase sigma-70 factor (ECF subfamily)